MLHTFAPHLAESQHVLIDHMIANEISLTDDQKARAAGCSRRAILRRSSKSPLRSSVNRVGRP